MKLYCEEFVLNVLPVIRKYIVRKLYKEYGMSQKEIAKKLGITQAAVSQYIKGIRGVKEIELSEEMQKIIDEICKELYNENTSLKIKNLFCKICSIILNSKCLVSNR